MPFDYSLDFDSTDFREHPELYRVGRGEQGVLLVEPYKSEILPHWRFKTPVIAKESSEKIYEMFLDYKKQDDFIGMDMARKFLQMGYTRSRRYANYKGGRKYDEEGDVKERQIDSEKAESAAIFEEKWKLAREDEDYLSRKKEHQKKYG
ncbi:cytoplasmic protein [Bacillus sp. MKU004]|nr:cytoplasmic protein [Bacillus sp. MKU004]